MRPEDCMAFMSERLPPDCAIPVIGVLGDPYTADRNAWGARVWRGGSLSPKLNLFAGISAFACPRTAKQGDFIARRKASFVCTTAIMLDDLGTKVPMSAMVLEPTWLVETSPDNFQGWYVLHQPCTDGERVASFINALIKKGLSLKADPGMSGVSRVGRLPGGVNAKAKYGPEGFVVRMERAGLSRYTLEDIAKAYGIPAHYPPASRPSVALPDGLSAMTPTAAVVLETFEATGRIMGHADPAGWWPVLCPWAHLHTGGCETGSAYIQPAEQNGWLGGYKCHHGHCQERTISDVLRWCDGIITAHAAQQQEQAECPSPNTPPTP